MRKLKLASSQDLLQKVSSPDGGKSRSYLVGKTSFQSDAPNTQSLKKQTPDSIEKLPNYRSQNLFTIKDTRFNEISSLSKRNKNLAYKLNHLEDELKEIDEFRIALNLEHNEVRSSQQDRTLIFRSLEVQRKIDNPHKPSPTPVAAFSEAADGQNYNQRRVDILKAQVQKQQRLIKRLTTIVQSTRNFYDELRSFLKYFTQILSTNSNANALYQANPDDIIFNQSANTRDVVQSVEKVQEKMQSQHAAFEDSYDFKEKGNAKLMKLNTQKEILDVIDKKQQYVSLKNLLQMFKSNEEKDNFVNMFTVAYNKVGDYERQNVEFSQMLDVVAPGNPKRGRADLDAAKDVKVYFRHPVRQFLKQYGHYFPVRTIFNSFPMKEKEKLEHFLLSLEGIQNSVGQNLRKVDTFNLFKGNPFYFRTELDMKQDRRSPTLDMPYALLEEREFIERYLIEPERFRTVALDQRMLHKLEKDLSDLLDHLFNMTTAFQFDALKPDFLQNQHFGQMSTLIRQSLESLVCLSTLVGQDINVRINKTLVVLETLQSTKSSLYRHPSRDPESENASHHGPKELAYVYSFNLQNPISFEKQYAILESLLDDLSAQYSRDDYQYVMVKKSQMTLKSLKNNFDIQRMIAQIKECEIEFLKAKMEMFEVDLEVFRAFMNQASQSIGHFFGSIDTKLHTLQASFNTILEQGKFDEPKVRKNFTLAFKRTLKEVGDWVSKYKDLGFKDNVINIQQLNQEFSKRVNFFYVKAETLSRKIEGRAKELDTDSKKR